MNERIKLQKEQIKKKLGTEVFERVYKVLWMHKNADSDYEKIALDMKKITGKNSELRQVCFSLE